MPSVIDHGTTRDGLLQLRRRWKPQRKAHVAVLLLHGIAEHSGRYEHVGDHLASAGFDTIAIDHRGHGQSGGRRAYLESWSEFLDDVQDQLAEVKTLGLPVLMLGHSMGGLIATSYCVDNRPRPDFLALSSPALGVDLRPPEKVLRAVGPIIRRIKPDLVLPNEFDPTVFASDVSVGERFRNDSLRNDITTISIGLELLNAIKVTTARLGRLDIPTICVKGSDDKLVPARACERLEVLGHHRIVYPGFGHEVFNEPAGLEVVDEIIDWVDRLHHDSRL